MTITEILREIHKGGVETEVFEALKEWLENGRKEEISRTNNGQKWLVRVNATKYNLFGAVRNYGDIIPWYFDCVKNKVKENDEVYMYFTKSEPNEGRMYSVGNIDDAYMRMVFKGTVIKTNADIEYRNRDSEFWNDKKQEKWYNENCSFLVLIRIEEFIYDKNILYSNLIIKNKRSPITEIVAMK